MFLFGWLLGSDYTNIHVYVCDLMILDMWIYEILCEHILILQRSHHTVKFPIRGAESFSTVLFRLLGADRINTSFNLCPLLIVE